MHRAHPRARNTFIRALVSLVVACIAAPAVAQSIDLSWRWTPGATDRFRLVETMLQTVSADQPTELRWTRTLEYTQTVEPADRGVTVTRTFDAVAVEAEGHGDSPVRYDSNDPATSPDHPLVAPFAQMLGRSLRVTLDADGRVTAVQGPDELLRAMLGPLEQAAPGLSGLLPQPPQASRIVDQTQAALDLIPGKRVRRGQSWPVDIPHALPLVGRLDTAVTARLQRIRRGVAVIDIEGRFDQSAPDGGRGATPTLLELKRSAISGAIEFDLEHGQVRRQTLDIDSAWSAAADLLEALGAEPTEQSIRQTVKLTRLTP